MMMSVGFDARPQLSHVQATCEAVRRAVVGEDGRERLVRETGPAKGPGLCLAAAYLPRFLLVRPLRLSEIPTA